MDSRAYRQWGLATFHSTAEAIHRLKWKQKATSVRQRNAVGGTTIAVGGTTIREWDHYP